MAEFLPALAGQNEALKTQVLGLLIHKKDIEQQNAGLTTQVLSLQEIRKDLEKRNAELETLTLNLQGIKKELERQNAGLRPQIKSLTDSRSQLQKNNKALKEQLSQSQEEWLQKFSALQDQSAADVHNFRSHTQDLVNEANALHRQIYLLGQQRAQSARPPGSSFLENITKLQSEVQLFATKIEGRALWLVDGRKLVEHVELIQSLVGGLENDARGSYNVGGGGNFDVLQMIGNDHHGDNLRIQDVQETTEFLEFVRGVQRTTTTAQRELNTVDLESSPVVRSKTSTRKELCDLVESQTKELKEIRSAFNTFLLQARTTAEAKIRALETIDLTEEVQEVEQSLQDVHVEELKKSGTITPETTMPGSSLIARDPCNEHLQDSDKTEQQNVTNKLGLESSIPEDQHHLKRRLSDEGCINDARKRTRSETVSASESRGRLSALMQGTGVTMGQLKQAVQQKATQPLQNDPETADQATWSSEFISFEMTEQWSDESPRPARFRNQVLRMVEERQLDRSEDVW